jgi:hypothetical protein
MNWISGLTQKAANFKDALTVFPLRGVRAFPVAALLVLLLSTTAYATTAPTISPSYRVFSSAPQTVTISGTAGNSFYYTVNGTDPNLTSTLYTGPFSVSATTTVKSVAYDGTTLSAITTSIVQIDPTTSNVPTSGLLCWFKADNGAIASGGTVSTWTDVSGNNLSGTQGTTANQPTFVSSASNGLPALGFNGTTQYFGLPNGFANFTSGMSLFVMAKPTLFYNTYARFIDFGSGPGYGNSVGFQQPAVSSLSLSVHGIPDTTVTTVQSSTALNLGLYQLFEATHDGTATATLLVNGIPVAQNTAMIAIPNVTRTYNAIGEAGVLGPFYFEGQIAEILLYNQILTSAQQANVENYLINRYLGGNAVVAAPIFSLPTSTLTAPNQVAISAPVGGSTFFTTDGSTPTQSSNSYSGPLQINFTQTVKAISVINGVSSSVASVVLTLDSLKYPSPSAGDTRPLTINLQLPATAQ